MFTGLELVLNGQSNDEVFLRDCAKGLGDCVKGLADCVKGLGDCVKGLGDCVKGLGDCLKGLADWVKGLGAENNEVCWFVWLLFSLWLNKRSVENGLIILDDEEIENGLLGENNEVFFFVSIVWLSSSLLNGLEEDCENGLGILDEVWENIIGNGEIYLLVSFVWLSLSLFNGLEEDCENGLGIFDEVCLFVSFIWGLVLLSLWLKKGLVRIGEKCLELVDKVWLCESFVKTFSLWSNGDLSVLSDEEEKGFDIKVNFCHFYFSKLKMENFVFFKRS